MILSTVVVLTVAAVLLRWDGLAVWVARHPASPVVLMIAAAALVIASEVRSILRVPTRPNAFVVTSERVLLVHEEVGLPAVLDEVPLDRVTGVRLRLQRYHRLDLVADGAVRGTIAIGEADELPAELKLLGLTLLTDD